MNFKSFISHLFAARSPSFGFTIFFAIISASVEACSIASLIPLMEVISGNLESNGLTLVRQIFFLTNEASKEVLLIYAGSLSVFLMLLSALTNSMALFAINKFGFRLGRKLSIKLFDLYISSSYEWVREQTVSNLQRKVVPEVDRVASGMFVASVVIVQKITSAIFLMLLMVYTDWSLTILIITFGIVAYITIFIGLRKRYKLFSKNVIAANEQRLSLTLEAFDGIKDLRLNKLDQIFIRQYNEASTMYCENQSDYLYLSQAIRFLIEAIGIAIMIGLIGVDLMYMCGIIRGAWVFS